MQYVVKFVGCKISERKSYKYYARNTCRKIFSEKAEIFFPEEFTDKLQFYRFLN